jgi:hypothetical protein
MSDLNFLLRQNLDPHHEIPEHIWKPWAEKTLREEFEDLAVEDLAEQYLIRDTVEEGRCYE